MHQKLLPENYSALWTTAEFIRNKIVKPKSVPNVNSKNVEKMITPSEKEK